MLEKAVNIGAVDVPSSAASERALKYPSPFLRTSSYAASTICSLVYFAFGGIFLPLLVLGAVTGSAFSQALSLCGFANTLPNFVILGMAGMFAAIVRAPVTGIILISEMTGSFSSLLPLVLVSLTAHIVADRMNARPVYDILLERLIRKKG